MWAFLILYSVKWIYWNDFVSKVLGFVFQKMKVPECLCRENEILVYLVSYSVKWKYWNVPCRENEILAYMVTILINMKDELVPWFKTKYLNLFGFKFGKIKLLKWRLSRKCDFSIYGYKYDKWEGWTSNSMSLDAKYDFNSTFFGFR